MKLYKLHKLDMSSVDNNLEELYEILNQHADYQAVGLGEEIYYVGWDDTVKPPWYRFWYIQNVNTGEYLYKYSTFEEMINHKFECGKTIANNYSEMDFYE